MSPINHALTGWLLANTASHISMRERAYITLAAVIADIDGLGVVAELLTAHTENPLLWWSTYHHVLAHNLLFGSILALLTLWITRQKLIALLVFCAFHSHLLEDLISGRHQDQLWGISYLYPFSKQQWLWHGQWELNAWPNMLFAVFCISLTLYLAWKRAYSPLALFSKKMDRHFIDALHQRFGVPKA
ncbi:MAG: metal-dependent hydrolase [Mariprofundaceae bacterium]|nr:metal-dependent hydrolase [Mariprofundaceae bacterium]